MWERIAASLRNANFLASGPRSPTPGAPYTYVTTKHFLSAFGMETLRDLPDIEADRSAFPIVGWAVEPGDVIVFDNHVVLHGRDAFNPQHGRRRLLRAWVA